MSDLFDLEPTMKEREAERESCARIGKDMMGTDCSLFVIKYIREWYGETEGEITPEIVGHILKWKPFGKFYNRIEWNYKSDSIIRGRFRILGIEVPKEFRGMRSRDEKRRGSQGYPYFPQPIFNMPGSLKLIAGDDGNPQRDAEGLVAPSSIKLALYCAAMGWGFKSTSSSKSKVEIERERRSAPLFKKERKNDSA